MRKRILVNMDGEASTGKGTLARKLAEHFDLFHIDSGKIFRAVGIKVKETAGDPLQIAEMLQPEDLERSDLGSEECGTAAAAISHMPLVREAVNKRIFWMIHNAGKNGAIIDGRAGAYEYPGDLMFYIKANEEECARRRCLQLEKAGKPAEFKVVLESIRARNKKDAERSVFPMKPAPSAIVIDNTDDTFEETFGKAVQICLERIGPELGR
ncbi:MAG: cytidylate kinase [Parcubacteria group bacterium]|nr:cytidylate kinase [Parcubacteria group bacterium]